MRLIAHRGLIYGPSTELENTIQQIDKALSFKFDVEIDLWYHNWKGTEFKWWLGHDGPQIEISIDYLKSLPLDKVWIHAKDITTLAQLVKETWPIHYFFHENDPVVLTSSNYLWTYPGKQLTDKSIMLLPEKTGMTHIEMFANTVHGICSDYVVEIANKLRR